MPAPEGIGLQDNVDVPFLLKPVDQLVFPEILQREIVGGGGRGESQLHNERTFLVVEAAVRGGGGRLALGQREDGHEMKEGGDAHGRHVRPVDIVERLRLDGRRWLERELVRIRSRRKVSREIGRRGGREARRRGGARRLRLVHQGRDDALCARGDAPRRGAVRVAKIMAETFDNARRGVVFAGHTAEGTERTEGRDLGAS